MTLLESWRNDMLGPTEKSLMFVVIFSTLTKRVKKVKDLGFETDILILSTWPSFQNTNNALAMDKNDLMQVKY